MTDATSREVQQGLAGGVPSLYPRTHIYFNKNTLLDACSESIGIDRVKL
ncbi:hypothetical protein [Paenibacillus sp. 203]